METTTCTDTRLKPGFTHRENSRFAPPCPQFVASPSNPATIPPKVSSTAQGRRRNRRLK